MTRWLPLLGVAVVAGSGCRCGGDEVDRPPVASRPVPAIDAAAPRRAEIYVAPGDYDFSDNPSLLERLRSDVYGYFRFVNLPFSQAVCERFHSRLAAMPTVNLHGDAHLANYAVTGDGRGLADFDDSSAGPAVIDLVRFGTSIALVGRMRDWPADTTARIVDEFLRGYREALADAERARPVPGFARRAAAEFRDNRKPFLRAAQLLMNEPPAAERAGFEPGYQRYAEMMLAENPKLPAQFFDIVKLGRLSVGYGSALDRKYLIRIRGESDRDDDDLVLEAKEVRDLDRVDCVNARGGGGAFRILIGQARIAEVPQQFLAQVPRPEGADPSRRPFWIHAWHPNYVELDVHGELPPDDVAEVAYDVGIQLGRGHVRQIASPLDAQLRRAQLEMMRDSEPEIRAAITDFSDSTWRGWQRFRTTSLRE